ncbi:MAG TPA: hypothetical protein PLM06_01270 [Anaerolineae bacterium]|nr:hypothetical protein [Anaerolineae bacterium]
MQKLQLKSKEAAELLTGAADAVSKLAPTAMMLEKLAEAWP